MGVDVILGMNGLVWVSSGTSVERREGGEGFDAEGVYSNQNDVNLSSSCPSALLTTLYQDIPPEGRIAISTVANIIQALADENVPLSDTLIADAYSWFASQGMGTGKGQTIVPDLGRRLLEEVVGIQATA